MRGYERRKVVVYSTKYLNNEVNSFEANLASLLDPASWSTNADIKFIELIFVEVFARTFQPLSSGLEVSFVRILAGAAPVAKQHGISVHGAETDQFQAQMGSLSV